MQKSLQRYSAFNVFYFVQYYIVPLMNVRPTTAKENTP